MKSISIEGGPLPESEQLKIKQVRFTLADGRIGRRGVSTSVRYYNSTVSGATWKADTLAIVRQAQRAREEMGT